ncbi:MAG: DUF2948 family protein [Alphaproteobacteria bacterium]
MQYPLKLRAETEEDLALMSGLLQDALIAGSDIQFEPGEGQFIAVFNRFCWELDQALDATDEERPGPGIYHRTHSALVVEGAIGVRSRSINLSDNKELLNLLSLHSDSDQIELMFSGEAALRIKAGSINVRLQDLGEPWPTKWRPNHNSRDDILAEENARIRQQASKS